MNDNTRNDKNGTPISAEDIAEVDGVSAPALRVVGQDDSRAQAREDARRRRSQVERPQTFRQTDTTVDDFPPYTAGMTYREYLGQTAPAPLTTRRSDLDVADVVAQIARPVLRHVSEAEAWWAWDGQRWASTAKGGTTAVIALCGETASTERASVMPWVPITTKWKAEKAERTALSEGYAYEWDDIIYDTDTDEIFSPIAPSRIDSNSAINGVAEVMETLLDTSVHAFDTDARILATPTAHIHLDTMDVVDPLPCSMTTKVTTAKLEMGSLAGSRFEQFVQEILPDPEVRLYVQKVMGTALDPTIHLRILPTFVGEGNNGKSILLDSVINAIGGENEGSYGCTLSQKVVQGGDNDHMSKIMPLKGARIAIISETTKGGKWNDTVLKALSGGDAITANWMRGNPITFQPTHTLFLATNNRPVIPAGAQAFWNRYREVTFPMHFTDNPVKEHHRPIDRELKNKLRTDSEMSAILEWLLVGLQAYRDEGLTTPDAVMEASRESKRNANPFAIFAQESFVVTKNTSTKAPASAIYALWSMYKSQNSSLRFQAPNSVQGVSDLQCEIDVEYEPSRHGKDFAGFRGLTLTEDGVELARDTLASGIKISRDGMRWLTEQAGR